jgi:hypothetical protein
LGAVVTLRTAFDTGLTVGVARSVYSPATSVKNVPSHAFDVLARWDQTPYTIGPSPRHQSISCFRSSGAVRFQEAPKASHVAHQALRRHLVRAAQRGVRGQRRARLARPANQRNEAQLQPRNGRDFTVCPRSSVHSAQVLETTIAI